jgi:hypothetical protein
MRGKQHLEAIIGQRPLLWDESRFL